MRPQEAPFFQITNGIKSAEMDRRRIYHMVDMACQPLKRKKPATVDDFSTLGRPEGLSRLSETLSNSSKRYWALSTPQRRP